MRHEQMNTYKLIYCAGFTSYGDRITVTVHTGKTYEQAEAIKKQDRRLTAVVEPKKAG